VNSFVFAAYSSVHLFADAGVKISNACENRVYLPRKFMAFDLRGAFFASGRLWGFVGNCAHEVVDRGRFGVFDSCM
jgi:hypothetical protein